MGLVVPVPCTAFRDEYCSQRLTRAHGTPLVHSQRSILKAAHRFPSKKRDGIIRDIKLEFRANKDIKDEEQIMKLRQLAAESLEQLQSYIQLAEGGDSLYLKGPCQG